MKYASVIARHKWLEPALIGLTVLAGFLLRASQIAQTYFLLDGDPYLHGSLVKAIALSGLLPTEIPGQVPAAGLFYPLGSHAWLGSLVATGLPLEPLLRWYGPILSVAFSLGLYLFAYRLTLSRKIALGSLLASLFIPFLTVRLSISLPEHFFLLATLVCLIGLVEWTRSRSYAWLAISVLAVAGGFAVHFSTYFLLPVLLAGLVIGVIPSEARMGRVVKAGLVALGAIVLAGGVLYLSYPILYETLRSFANTAAKNPEFLPAPSLVDWRRELNTAVLILAVPGILWLFRPKAGIGWRALTIFAVYTLTILAFLQILPSLHLYNLLPFRAFTYFAIPVAIAAGAGMVAIGTVWRPAGLFVAGLLLVYHATLSPSGWDIDLIPAEVEAIHWLDSHTAGQTLVYAPPLMGRQILLYSHNRVNYDLGYFLEPKKADDIRTRLKGFQELVDAPGKTYVFISDYKMSPAFNRGFARGGTFADLPLKRLDDEKKIFKRVFKNNAVRIYEVTP